MVFDCMDLCLCVFSSCFDGLAVSVALTWA